VIAKVANPLIVRELREDYQFLQRSIWNDNVTRAIS